ncbi:MAG: type 1 glutamine amidotransferase [Spirochaetes bacterium]|nr:type 1 glutamine amidotransferase [Spirochaetota bacterium]
MKGKLHYFQHVPFEGLGVIEEWAKERLWDITVTPFFKDRKIPPLNKIDLLIIMGGPMSTNEENKYPWLVQEKKVIEQAIKRGVPVIGICLGAQIIADVLGARIYRNRYKEIGWFPVNKTEPGKQDLLFKDSPDKLTVFHWHGDTFDIPEKAIHCMSSEGCLNQAFNYKNRILGFQYHLETTESSMNTLISNCKDEIIKEKYIQTENKMVQGIKNFGQQNHKVLFNILSKMVKEQEKS